MGSKEFTEQLVLGQITAEALRAAGALVSDRTGIEGSEATRRALTAGQADMYWEYTGTAQLVHLGQEPVSDPERQYAQVARADRANAVEWLAPAPPTTPSRSPGLQRAYGMRYPSELVVLLPDEGEIYGEVDRGVRRNVGEVFLTDGRIVANELFVLEDDRRFLATYTRA
ncbi:MAG: hypothetical protein M3P39_01520 [Actinomycetota bacterium]|nr:hypothetical protein [Actinomycetota bacterium]